MPAAFVQPDDRSLWRFGVISPLLHQSPQGTTLSARIDQLAGQQFFAPDGTQKRLCADTIRHWLMRYRTCGVDGLRTRPRKDQGTTTVSDQLQQALTDLRKEQPCWTIKRMLNSLRLQGMWNGRTPGKSALYRFATAHGLKRAAVAPPSPVRSFEFPFFGDLWSADFLHGPKVRRGTRFQKSYLHAIIDDATRYVVAARFHLAEDTRAMLSDLMLAVRRFGVPKRLYTDNGAAFRSRHLRMAAAKLGVSLPHTPPYTPRGRGKIERFFRSLRDGLLAGRPITSLEALNADLAAWITAYHSTLHHALGMSPLERKLCDTGPALNQIAPACDIDDLFRMEQTKRIGSDGCIRLFRKRFEVPDAIPGTMVTVSYLPWSLDTVLVGPQRVPAKPLDMIHNALRFDKPRRGYTPNRTKEQHP